MCYVFTLRLIDLSFPIEYCMLFMNDTTGLDEETQWRTAAESAARDGFRSQLRYNPDTLMVRIRVDVCARYSIRFVDLSFPVEYVVACFL